MSTGYQVIYADPPWQYDNAFQNDPAFGGVTYRQMSTPAICEVPVRQIADKNCALFLWVTMPMLQHGFRVMEAWGFEYVTCAFTWVKQNSSSFGIYSGLGHWTNANAELCLLGRMGKLERRASDVKQIMLAPVLEHSRKPPEIRERIVRLLGDIPKIELFARRKYQGWDVWGDEVESDISLSPPDDTIQEG